MMLFDKIDDRLRKMMLTRPSRPVFDVGDDHQRAHSGLERCMPILAKRLVFNKVGGLEHLSDVVKVRSDSRQQAMGLDAVGAASAIAATLMLWL